MKNHFKEITNCFSYLMFRTALCKECSDISCNIISCTGNGIISKEKLGKLVGNNPYYPTGVITCFKI